jgi:CDP-diacylglycerol--glycerol-3-phosphate 3-phosphatidyltransferase
MSMAGHEPIEDGGDRPGASPGGEPAREQLRDQLRGRLSASKFGPSALATPANAITIARLLATPILVVLVAVGGTGWAPFAVAFAIGATDGVDGWIARRQGATRSGAFLDPLADKVVVLSALFVLAAKSEIAWWPVGLIAAREVAITVYRSLVGRRGVSIPARTSAKVKTLVQGIAILLALAPPVARHHGVVGAVLWVAVAFTLVTGGQYLIDGRKAIRSVDPVGGPPVSPAHGTPGSVAGPVPPRRAVP